MIDTAMEEGALDGQRQREAGNNGSAEGISKKPPSTFRRVFTYSIVRIVTIGITIVVGVFLAIVVANKGKGFDNTVRDRLQREARRQAASSGYSYFSDEQDAEVHKIFQQLAEEAGLNDPYLEKHLKYTWAALRLDLGNAIFARQRTAYWLGQQSAAVKDILIDRLPNTLLLVGTADFLVFVVGIPLSLYLSRNYGNWIDKLLNLLSPLSSVPSWVHGIMLIVIFAITFRILPPGGMIDNPVPDTSLGIFISRLRHLILPAIAIFLNLMFQLVYTWRNYFMIYSNEDYVDLAVAQGLSGKVIQRQYILRPSLPYVITSFALTLVGFWQMTTAMEVAVSWDGIGRMYVAALPNYWGESFYPGDMGLIIGIVVLFAYLLGMVVLLLDVAYAIVDPRIRMGGGGSRIRATRYKGRFQPLDWVRKSANAVTHAVPRFSLSARLLILAGLLIGVLAGGALGWGVWPVAYTDAAPDMLHQNFREDYIQMVVDSFNTNQDSGLARLRLEALGDQAAPAMAAYIEAVQQDPSFEPALANFLENYRSSAQLPTRVPAADLTGEPESSDAGNAAWVVLVILGAGAAVGFGWLLVRWIVRIIEKKKNPQSVRSETQISYKQSSRLQRVFTEMMRYPSAAVGLVILLILLVGSLYAVVRYPYEEIGTTWYTDASYNSQYVPKTASPKWINFFRKNKLPETIVIDSETSPEIKSMTLSSKGNPDYSFTFVIDYPYNSFPQETKLYFTTEFESKNPFATFTWTTPDGREFALANAGLNRSEVYDLAENIDRRDLNDHLIDYKYQENDISAEPLLHGIFANPNAAEPEVVPGTYTLQVDVLAFEPDTEVNVELVVMGQTYGLAGTDFMRRDLIVPMLWGMPFALGLGLFGALITTIVSMLVAAFGVWFGGWADALVQRITEANMILPVVAVAILFYSFYGASLWTILTLIVVLNAFGSPTKTFRAAFLQVKDAGYIEAAQAYGAPNSRIIFKYMIPRILPVMIPQLVTLIPGFIFLEATLGMMNVKSDLPTWGRVIYEGLRYGSAWGSKFWVLEPITLLLLTGFAFSMMGFALDRVLNPRLQEGK